MKMTGNERVVLVPGLGLGGLELCLLSLRLRRRGFGTTIFWHCPWSGDLDSKAARLDRLVSTRKGGSVVHLVGHSMGGLIVTHMLATYNFSKLGRVVTMGTPHMGSAAARRISRYPVIRKILGRALPQALALGPGAVPNGVDLGTMAGRLDLRLGFLFRLDKPNDTIVAEGEAKHPEASGHVLLNASHSGLLMSKTAADEMACFLKSGAFEARNPGF